VLRAAARADFVQLFPEKVRFEKSVCVERLRVCGSWKPCIYKNDRMLAWLLQAIKASNAAIADQLAQEEIYLLCTKIGRSDIHIAPIT